MSTLILDRGTLLSASTLLVLIALNLASMAFASPLSGRVQALHEERSERDEALQALGDNVEVRWGDKGHVRGITGQLEIELPTFDQRGESAAKVQGKLRLPLSFDGNETLVRPRYLRGALGTSFMRYRQEVAGIPVYGAGVVIAFDRYGRATSIANSTIRDSDLARIPSVAEMNAEKRAIAHAFSDGEAASVHETRLVYYPVSDGRAGQAGMASAGRGARWD